MEVVERFERAREPRLKWDETRRFSREHVNGPASPLPLTALGIAYNVDLVVEWSDPKKTPGLQKGDVIGEVRFRKPDAPPGDFEELKPFKGAFFHTLLQMAGANKVDLKVKRQDKNQENGQTEVEVEVAIEPDDTWPAVDRGFQFQTDSRLQKADGILEALEMGGHRTVRMVRVIYQTLYATIFRQISPKTMSGPLSIANVSYKIAGQDIWFFILFIGLININLAVVNFLPVPVLDGGHMMFLLYEKIRGKPAGERDQRGTVRRLGAHPGPDGVRDFPGRAPSVLLSRESQECPVAAGTISQVGLSRTADDR